MFPYIILINKLVQIHCKLVYIIYVLVESNTLNWNRSIKWNDIEEYIYFELRVFFYLETINTVKSCFLNVIFSSSS